MHQIVRWDHRTRVVPRWGHQSRPPAWCAVVRHAEVLLKTIPLTLLLFVSALAPLSAVPLMPAATFDYNPLLVADSGVRLNTAPKFVRIDRGAQLSGAYTSLLPDALRYSVMDPAAAAAVPESPVVGTSASSQAAPDVELMASVNQIHDFVSFIGRSLPRQDFLIQISRELLGISQNSRFDLDHVIVAAANLLSSALARG